MAVRSGELTALADAIEHVRSFATPADAACRRSSARNRHSEPATARSSPRASSRTCAASARSKRSPKRAIRDRLALAVLVRENGRSVRDLAPRSPHPTSIWLRALQVARAQPAAARGRARPARLAVGPAGRRVRRRDASALAQAWQSPAPLDLRVNPTKTTRDAALAALASEGFDARPTPYSPLGIRVHGPAIARRASVIADGRLEVQDEGSQLVGIRWSRRGAATWWWISAPAPAARRCCWARSCARRDASTHST